VKKFIFLIILTLLAIGFAAGCSDKVSGQKPATADRNINLNISAAASLHDVLSEIGAIYEQKIQGVHLVFNFASSGTIKQQIEQGAPADLFISAGQKQMDALSQKGLVHKSETVARNELVVIMPVNSGKTAAELQSLTSPAFGKIGIGTPETVPAGEYGKEALENAGLWSGLLPKLVMAKDVRQVLVYVESGNADAGLVYATDAKKSDNVQIALVVPANLHSPIVYPAAVVTASKQTQEAAEFLSFLKTDEAQAIIKKHGFVTSTYI